MKTILHLTFEAPTFPNKGWKENFEAIGWEYHSINWQRLKFNEGLIGSWQRIFHSVDNIKPDVIFLQVNIEGFVFPAEAIELSKNAFTVLWTQDVREDISWIEDIAPYLGLTLFTNYDDVEMLRSKGIYNVDYMQTFADANLYKPTNFKNTVSFPKIIFIGNRYDNTNLKFPLSEQRTKMVRFMQDEFGEKFIAYGRGYGEQITNCDMEIFSYNSCKIAITQNQFNRNGYTSNRLFRALNSGAFTISQYYDGIEEDFEYKINYWNNFNELKQLCETALSNDENRIQNAKECCYHSRKNHSVFNRVNELKFLTEKYSSWKGQPA